MFWEALALAVAAMVLIAVGGFVSGWIVDRGKKTKTR